MVSYEIKVILWLNYGHMTKFVNRNVFFNMTIFLTLSSYFEIQLIFFKLNPEIRKKLVIL